MENKLAYPGKGQRDALPGMTTGALSLPEASGLFEDLPHPTLPRLAGYELVW